MPWIEFTGPLNVPGQSPARISITKSEGAMLNPASTKALGLAVGQEAKYCVFVDPEAGLVGIHFGPEGRYTTTVRAGGTRVEGVRKALLQYGFGPECKKSLVVNSEKPRLVFAIEGEPGNVVAPSEDAQLRGRLLVELKEAQAALAEWTEKIPKAAEFLDDEPFTVDDVAAAIRKCARELVAAKQRLSEAEAQIETLCTDNKSLRARLNQANPEILRGTAAVASPLSVANPGPQTEPKSTVIMDMGYAPPVKETKPVAPKNGPGEVDWVKLARVSWELAAPERKDGPWKSNLTTRKVLEAIEALVGAREVIAAIANRLGIERMQVEAIQAGYAAEVQALKDLDPVGREEYYRLLKAHFEMRVAKPGSTRGIS